MKKILLAAGALLLAFAMFACGSSGRYSRIAGELGLDLSRSVIELEEDSHGGFHNDGLLRLQLRLAEDDFEPGEAWEPLPMDQETETLFYGVHDEISDFMPKAEKGYYFVLDRGDPSDGPVLERPSYNFTIALYDTASGMLYYCALDT